ncbi:MAG: 1-acyl-sn-glycerol-3-phosphate acyltransferase [Cloacibacillus porcorum]|nr:1-acyl-sn-glycerol-3-phosphate acyltransferase [Cloacibacillus porcorum]
MSVYGKEKIPRDRTVIVAPNHASYLDPPVVGYAFYPEYLKFIAWEKLFSFPPLGAFLRVMGSVPVSPENKNSSAALLRLVMGFIEEGYNVFICPEGHRTENGRLQPLEGGVAIMSLKTGAPVIPTYAAGTYRALSPQMKFPRPRKLTVTFGDPIDPAALPEGLTEKEKRRYILDKIEEFFRAEVAKDKAKYPLD